MEVHPDKGAAIVLVLVLSLSGCASRMAPVSSPTSSLPTTLASPGPTLPPTINRSADLFALKPEMVGCQFFGIALQISPEDVQSRLPPGYKADGLASPATDQVNIEAHRCDSLIINNETVVSAISWVQTVARVQVNETLSKGADYQFYALEMFVSNQTLASLFAALGFNATLANLGLKTTDSISTLTVSVGANLWYEAEGTNGLGRPVNHSYLERYHQMPEGNGPRWISRNHTYAFPGIPGEGAVRITGGVLHSMRPGDQGAMPAITQFAPAAKASLNFGRL